MLTGAQCDILSRSPLFLGVEREKIRGFLESSGIYPRKLEAGACVVGQGDTQTEVCVVLSGSVRGEKLAANGRVVTVNVFYPGHVFGDVLSGASEKSPVSVRMAGAGEIIGIPFSALIGGEERFSDVRERVLRNMFSEIGKKYFALLRRVSMLINPTLRGKIAVYLLDEGKNSKKPFIVSHSREEQARLLNCERSALSRELSRMKNEGIIDFRGSRFEILDLKSLKTIAQ